MTARGAAPGLAQRAAGAAEVMSLGGQEAGGLPAAPAGPEPEGQLMSSAIAARTTAAGIGTADIPGTGLSAVSCSHPALGAQHL